VNFAAIEQTVEVSDARLSAARDARRDPEIDQRPALQEALKDWTPAAENERSTPAGPSDWRRPGRRVLVTHRAKNPNLKHLAGKMSRPPVQYDKAGLSL